MILTDFLHFHDFLNMNSSPAMMGLYNLSYAQIFFPKMLSIRINILECLASKNMNTMLEIGRGPY